MSLADATGAADAVAAVGLAATGVDEVAVVPVVSAGVVVFDRTDVLVVTGSLLMDVVDVGEVDEDELDDDEVDVDADAEEVDDDELAVVFVDSAAVVVLDATDSLAFAASLLTALTGLVEPCRVNFDAGLLQHCCAFGFVVSKQQTLFGSAPFGSHCTKVPPSCNLFERQNCGQSGDCHVGSVQVPRPQVFGPSL